MPRPFKFASLIWPPTPAQWKALSDSLDDIYQRLREGLDGSVPTTHATTHQNGGNDEISVTGLSGLLADSQTPLAHKTSHQSGGSDAIQLDNLAAPDDNTDLDVSTSAHGLTPKLPNDATKFLGGTGSWAVPAAVGKAVVACTGTDTQTSDTTLANDSELHFAVAAGETWVVDVNLLYEGSTAGDFKFDWSLPSGSGSHGGVRLISTATGVSSGVNMNGASIGTAISIGAVGAGSLCHARLYATITIGVTGGTVYFQHAQNSSDGTATKRLPGSWLVAHRTT